MLYILTNTAYTLNNMHTMSTKNLLENNIEFFPSLICADLCNLEQSIKKLEKLKFTNLHLDIVDGHFSPSLPLGMEIIHQLRNKTALNFDVHLMVSKLDFFLNETLNIPVERVCFHIETTIHADKYLNNIREVGSKAGLALCPGTPISSIEYLVGKCDFILLMLINPGFAGNENEKQIPYAVEKIQDLKSFLNKRNINIPIEVDGRISIENIPMFYKAGATEFVVGSTCLFKDGNIFKRAEELYQIKNRLRGWQNSDT